MAVLRLAVNAEVVNVSIPEFPFVVRRDYGEAAGFEYDQADGSGPVAIPTSQIGTLKTLALTVDKAVTVSLGDIVLEPGGLVLIYGGVPATSPPTVDNASGDTAKIRGVALGD